MVQPSRTTADDLQVHINALTALKARTRLDQPDSVNEAQRICAGIGSLFPRAASRPVNPPIARMGTGCWW